MKMIEFGKASDEMFDFLVDLVKLAKNLFGELLDASLPALLPHSEDEAGAFNKLCGESVRCASNSAMRRPPTVSR